MLIDDERVTFVEGTVRRSIGPALVEVGGARESSGGMAAHAQLLGKFGRVNVSAEALLANDFHLRGGAKQSLRDCRLALDAPLKIGRTVLPAHADVHLTDRRDGSQPARGRGAAVGQFRPLQPRDRRSATASNILSSGRPRRASSTSDLIGSGHIGDVRLRGATELRRRRRSARFRTAELSAYWSASEHCRLGGRLAYDAVGHRGRARITPHPAASTPWPSR